MTPLPWWRHALVVDLAITILVVILVLVITPGVVIAGLLALLVLLGFAVKARRSARQRGGDAVRVRPPRAKRSGGRTGTRPR